MGHWIVDTSGIGSIIVITVGLSVLVAYIYMLRWIQTAPPDPVPANTGGPEEPVEASEAGGEEA